MSNVPPLVPGKPTRPVLKSKTTATVAASGGTVIGLLAFIRTSWPEILPWPAEHDATVATFAAVVIIPFLSRLVKKILASKG